MHPHRELQTTGQDIEHFIPKKKGKHFHSSNTLGIKPSGSSVDLYPPFQSCQKTREYHLTILPVSTREQLLYTNTTPSVLLTTNSDCKNTTDDALQNYLTSLPEVRQSHFYTDVKLALGYTAVIISAVCFAFDYKLGFEATKGWTAIAVVVYFALNGAFTYWIWAVEKGLVFTGNWKGRNVSSHDHYTVLLSRHDFTTEA